MRASRVALVVLVLAGCVAPPGVQDAPAALTLDPEASFLALDHDHTDAALHEAIGGMRVTAHPALENGVGYFGEIDVMGDILAIMTEQPEGAVFLLDIADPDAPTLLSRIALDNAIVTDVKLAPDAKTLFVSTSNWLTLGAHQRVARDPSALPTLASALGIATFDISDPKAPRELGVTPAGPDGAHMLDVHDIDGTTWVFAATPIYSYAGIALNEARTAASAEPIMIFRVAGGTLEKVAEHDPPHHGSAHDMTVVDDEGRVLMLVAYLDGPGVIDVTDPAAPKHLGDWNLVEAGIQDSNTHTVMLARVEGKRVLVATPELGEAGQMHIIDADDFGAMKLIGTWNLPEWQERKGVEWSPHNVNLLDGKAYFAHYHGGAWVLDIGSLAKLVAPEVVGYFAPDLAENVPPPTFLYEGAVPSTWDVVPAKGRVFVSDMGTGLYVLAPDWTMPDAAPYGDRTTPSAGAP